MSNIIYRAEQEVEAARQQGLAACRRGWYSEGCLNNSSVAGRRFDAAYEVWMNLRCMAGDSFALSLGYGRAHSVEVTT